MFTVVGVAQIIKSENELMMDEEPLG